MVATCHARRGPFPPHALEQIACSLAEADAPSPAVVGVLERRCGHVDVAIRPTGPDGPLAELLGWRAPPAWPAVGVVAPLGPNTTTGGPGGCVALLVDRWGGTACARRVGAPPATVLEVTGGPVLDACRRALGLATAPPAVPLRAMWSHRWLDRLVERLATGEPLDPEGALALHPLAHLATGGVDLVDLADSAAGSATWAELRSAAAARTTACAASDPTLVTWMDDGMVARWLTERLPPRADLEAVVGELATPAVARSVAAVLRAWD